MSACRLYCPNLSLGTNALSARESHHAVAALRLDVDSEVILFDGAGQEATGRVVRIDRRRLLVDATEVSSYPFDVPRRLTLAVAMPRTHRQGYLVEKCTELGVAAVWPIIAQRSVTRPGTAAVRRWSQRAIEAARQAQRRWTPTVAAPVAFAESIERIGEFDSAALADAETSGQPLTDFFRLAPDPSSMLVWVGPEGGWTDAERDRAIEAGATRVRLGPTVLRTETAAVAVCAAAALV